jgi:hypothetical protein
MKMKKHGIENIMRGAKTIIRETPFMATEFCANGDLHNFSNKARKDVNKAA